MTTYILIIYTWSSVYSGWYVQTTQEFTRLENCEKAKEVIAKTTVRSGRTLAKAECVER